MDTTQFTDGLIPFRVRDVTAHHGGFLGDRAAVQPASSPVQGSVASFSPVAALYVESGGCYFDLPGVDAWDVTRDARKYRGPHPVVAHPPCQRWGAMAKVNFVRWGGEHNRPGNDGGCFASALAAVRTWGGVLEHPAKSRAWKHFGLTAPSGAGWQPCLGGGWVCEVWQSAYGHRANKATWLYSFGVGKPFDLDWSRPVGSHQVGFHDQRGKARNKPTLGRREALATPEPFRDLLLSIARSAKPFQNTTSRQPDADGLAGSADRSFHDQAHTPGERA